jgi:hypothetical protein
MNTTVSAIIALLAAIGGIGGIVQLIKAIQSWRDGIRQRVDQAEEKLVQRLEGRIDRLEMRADLDAEYIRRLVHALGTAGIPIPSRKEMPDGSTADQQRPGA